jgi:hypothetical protein
LNWFFEPKLSEPEISTISIMVNSRSSSKPLRALRYNVQLHSINRTNIISVLVLTHFAERHSTPLKTYDTLERCDRSIFGF